MWRQPLISKGAQQMLFKSIKLYAPKSASQRCANGLELKVNNFTVSYILSISIGWLDALNTEMISWQRPYSVFAVYCYLTYLNTCSKFVFHVCLKSLKNGSNECFCFLLVCLLWLFMQMVSLHFITVRR